MILIAKTRHEDIGTLNNIGNYAFILTAIDGQINGLLLVQEPAALPVETK